MIGELDVGGIDATCPFIRDDQGNRWILIWPPGVTWDYRENRLLLISADGSVLARQGDRIGIRGAYGLFYGDEVEIDLDLSLVKPGLSDSDTLRNRRNALRVWAPKHGLAYGESWGNGRFARDWEFTIEDGMFVDDKVVELLALPEVRSASRRGGLASMCSLARPGALLTAVSIEFVEPAASPRRSSLP